ncbi:MAG: hypothetical protein QOE66_1798 [Chloroflexota bacterium]|nr:hypothetical protein [Chloroflexota bacterium]
MNLPGALLAVVAIVALAWLGLVGVLWLHRPARDLAEPALRLVPDVARLVRSLLGSADVPRSVKLILGCLFVYLLSPIDLVPEFLPVIGSLDDLIIAALVLRWASRRIGVDTLRAHWSGSPDGFDLLRRFLGL